jgi:predicted RND superfamily exporter protein
VVDTYTMEFLSPDHPVRRDSELIESRLAPYVPMEFLVRPADGAARPELLTAIGRWQRAGERLPGVGWSWSLIDDAAAGMQLEPPVDAAAALRVTFSVRMQSSKNVDRTMRELLAEARLPAGAMVQPAGYLPLYVRMIDYVVESQISGFAFAFIAVFGVIALAFRSARIAALAVPSNLLPLLVIFGAMGIAGIRLDAATVTIATVVLGLIVDDTVHFLHCLRAELGRHDDPAAALRATVGSAGHAVLITALVMTLGFSVFALSEIKSLVHFGLLIALAMATSVLTDLVLIPALVMLRRRPC